MTARALRRGLAYAWALPTTLLGLALAPVALLTGGRVRARAGVLEVYGGAVAWLLRRCTLLPGGAAAMTLGHVILGTSPAALDRSLAHELVHVRQCERWGPFFLPAYLLATAWIALRGGRGYRDNPFEREAYERTG